MTPPVPLDRRSAAIIQIPHPPKVSLSLPKIWVGLALMTLYWLLRLPIVSRTSTLTSSELDSFLLLLVFSAWGYWLFCIYRIHRVLGKITNGLYPIGPAKALGLSFIPLFNVFYWNFKWTREVADFIRARDAKVRVGRHWPGLVLLLAWMLGLFVRPGSGLALVFLVGMYLTRKLAQVVRCSEKACFTRKTEPVSLAISAGIGAAFAFILAQALTAFPGHEHKSAEVTAILLVSLGLMWFIEPASEKMRHWCGLEPEHPHVQARRPILFQVAIFVFLFVTSITHALLHEQIFHQLSTTGMVLLIGLIASGSITYSWVAGAQRLPRESAKLGLLGGVLVGVFMLSPLRLAIVNTMFPANARTAAAIVSPVPGVGAEKGINHLSDRPDAEPQPNREHPINMFLIAVACPVFGLVGGFFLDRTRSVRLELTLGSGLALSAIVVLVVARLQSEVMGQHAWNIQVLADVVCFAAGWWIGLFVYPTVGLMLGSPKPRPEKAIGAGMAA